MVSTVEQLQIRVPQVKRGYWACAAMLRHVLDDVLVEVEVGLVVERLVSDVCEATWAERHRCLGQAVTACQDQVCGCTSSQPLTHGKLQSHASLG